MSLIKLLDSDVEILIELRKNERAHWNVTFIPVWTSEGIRTII